MTLSFAVWYLGILLAVLVPSTRAQTIEYTIPTEYKLVPGHLSVTFEDTVSATTAQAIVFRQGYYVAANNIHPVEVKLAIGPSLPSDEQARLGHHPAVVSVRQYSLQNPFDDDPPEPAPVQIYVSMSPTLTEEAARQLATTLLPNYTIESVLKRPNELVITVDEGTEEWALSRLDMHPKIKYVAYLSDWEE